MTRVRQELFDSLAPHNGEFAERLYQQMARLPILDYHCHLSPKEIYEDKEFSNIGEMWLRADHYKWRLMRAAGTPEDLITGNADWREKFFAYVKAVSTAYGNPLRDFSRLELDRYFKCDLPLTSENAELIWERASETIRKESLSPRKLIACSNVEFIATTDDPTDSLEYHVLLRAEREKGGMNAVITPTFRADRLFQLQAVDFSRYVAELSRCVGFPIVCLSDYLSAISKRMVFFKQNGCLFADIGMEDFPKTQGDRQSAERAFTLALRGKAQTADVDGFQFFLYQFWLEKCKEYGFTVQLHLNPLRNTNTAAFHKTGADSGFDAINDHFHIKWLQAVLDAAEIAGGLPRIIIYTLNPTLYYPLIVLSGAFPRVTLGIAWWFNDNKYGIFDYLERMSELTHINSVLGMLTDSRSFLSYARHDYFRIILAAFLSQFPKDEKAALIEIAKNLSYNNLHQLIKGE